MHHREERSYTITLHLHAEFPEDYEGDADGFAWYRRFEEELRPALVAAVLGTLRRAPGVRVVAAPRGRDPDSTLELDVDLSPAD